LRGERGQRHERVGDGGLVGERAGTIEPHLWHWSAAAIPRAIRLGGDAECDRKRPLRLPSPATKRADLSRWRRPVGRHCHAPAPNATTVGSDSQPSWHPCGWPLPAPSSVTCTRTYVTAEHGAKPVTRSQRRCECERVKRNCFGKWRARQDSNLRPLAP